MARVLIVEDDAVIADGMARHLGAAGFDPVVVGRGELGLHGFARFETFAVETSAPDFARLTLTDDARTRAVYPFAFMLAICTWYLGRARMGNRFASE